MCKDKYKDKVKINKDWLLENFSLSHNADEKLSLEYFFAKFNEKNKEHHTQEINDFFASLEMYAPDVDNNKNNKVSSENIELDNKLSLSTEDDNIDSNEYDSFASLNNVDNDEQEASFYQEQLAGLEQDNINNVNLINELKKELTAKEHTQIKELATKEELITDLRQQLQSKEEEYLQLSVKMVQQSTQLNEFIQNLEASFIDIGNKIQTRVIILAMNILKELLGTEKLNSDLFLYKLQNLIDEQHLFDIKEFKFFVNPTDVNTFEKEIIETFKSYDWQLVTTHDIKPGGFKIIHKNGEIDSTIETKLAVIEHIISESNN